MSVVSLWFHWNHALIYCVALYKGRNTLAHSLDVWTAVLLLLCTFCLHSLPSFPVFRTYATVELAARRNSVFNATFLLNRSDEKQWKGRIKAGGCWFQSGRCVEASLMAEAAMQGVNHTSGAMYMMSFRVKNITLLLSAMHCQSELQLKHIKTASMWFKLSVYTCSD